MHWLRKGNYVGDLPSLPPARTPAPTGYAHLGATPGNTNPSEASGSATRSIPPWCPSGPDTRSDAFTRSGRCSPPGRSTDHIRLSGNEALREAPHHLPQQIVAFSLELVA